MIAKAEIGEVEGLVDLIARRLGVRLEDADLHAFDSGASDSAHKNEGIEIVRAKLAAILRGMPAGRQQFETENRQFREELLLKELEGTKARAAQELADARAILFEELERSNKDLEAFSYSVSHDLRSPLRAIAGYTQMLEEDYADRLDEEGRRLIGVIRENSGFMGSLIDDLLAFSRLGRQAINAVQLDMAELAADAWAEACPDGSAEFRVRPLPAAYADRALLRQVWINLLSNAVKYSSKRERPLVALSGREDAGESVYSVIDNGAGFDMRYYKKLFGVFQRLHDAEEFAGTGVGLAIVHRVITRHGGRIWAEGKVGEGAAFHFSLPRGSDA